MTATRADARRPTYSSAHHRVRRLRGRARDHPCADCDARASSWSYTGGDPDELRDARHGAYSLDVARYVPRCARCHVRADRRARRPVYAQPELWA
jgi:hypothetical protein